MLFCSLVQCVTHVLRSVPQVNVLGLYFKVGHHARRAHSPSISRSYDIAVMEGLSLEDYWVSRITAFNACKSDMVCHMWMY